MAGIIFGRSTAHKQKTESDNADYLCVIGAGLPRTGTSSLKAALEILGFGPCHHMSELFKKPERSISFARALDGRETNFHELMKSYGSTVDIPASLFYKEIHQAYPKAKLILTVRDSGEKWFESFKNSIEPLFNDIFYYIAIYPIRFMRLSCAVTRKVSKKWMTEYGEIGPQMHELHNARVLKENQQNKLLVFNVKEGWPPLCKFLDVSIPKDTPFPQVNDTKHMQRLIRKARMIGLSAWGCIVAALAVVIYLFITLTNF